MEIKPRSDSHATRKWGVQLIALVLLLAAISLITWQLADGATPDGTTVTALLLAGLATMALAYPRSFISLGERVSNVDAFGIKLELRVQEAKLAIEQIDKEEDGHTVTVPDWPSSNKRAIEQVAGELRSKLQFTSKALLGNRAKIPDEVIVSNLANEALLTPRESRLCLDLLGDLYKRLDELEKEDCEDFLGRAWEFAYRFASRTFDRQARILLVNSGWQVVDFKQDRGHRPDFIILREGSRALVAARVADPRKTAIETGARIADVEFPLPDMRRLVVVPDHVDHLWGQVEDPPVRVHERVLLMRVGQLAAEPELANKELAGLPLVEA